MRPSLRLAALLLLSDTALSRPLRAQVRTILDPPKQMVIQRDSNRAQDTRVSAGMLRVDTLVIIRSDATRAEALDTVRVATGAGAFMLATVSADTLVPLPRGVDPTAVPEELRKHYALIVQCSQSIERYHRWFPGRDQETGECYWLQKGYSALENASLVATGSGTASAVVELVSRVVGPVRVGLTQAVSTGGDVSDSDEQNEPATAASSAEGLARFLAGGGNTAFTLAVPMKVARTERAGVPMGFEMHPVLRLTFPIPGVAPELDEGPVALGSVPASAQLSIDGQWRIGPEDVQAFGTFRGGGVSGTKPFAQGLGSERRSFFYADVTGGVRLLRTYSLLVSRAFFSGDVFDDSRWYFTLSTTPP